MLRLRLAPWFVLKQLVGLLIQYTIFKISTSDIKRKMKRQHEENIKHSQGFNISHSEWKTKLESSLTTFQRVGLGEGGLIGQ